MSTLTGDDFPAFFRAVHGSEPFPWQAALARRVVADGRWPALLDLPTGTGKTAAIDIAVFHLACEAERGARRTAPMRILFVIDRRIVVDEAFRRARVIAEALVRPESDVVRTVRRRLSLLSGDDEHPLDAVRLRGGMPQERDWARSPSQPLVAVSTVDQVGSRLLFRGYGVSPRMSPVHAGLVGADALWLLDEMHLSQPLVETLASIAASHDAQDGDVARAPRLAPFGMVSLSATPGVAVADAVKLTSADRSDRRLDRRLTARKIARVERIGGDLGEAFANRALNFMRGVEPPAAAVLGDRRRAATKRTPAVAIPVSPARRIAVVVNRVDLARTVFEMVNGFIAAAGLAADVLLLMGRVRPLDRDEILRRMRPLFADAGRPDPERPIIVVATQTIEAGADLDVDALVTEVAPLDALRQRFGRLDRLGLRGESRAAILVPSSAEDSKRSERIYGGAVKATAEWLGSIGPEIDMGVDGLEARIEALAHDPALFESLLSPRQHAPVLLAPYLELWAATWPAPPATPEPALFLHGPGRPAEVQVAWRADVDTADWQSSAARLDLCPPSSLEAMPLPVWAVRAWLGREGDDTFGDTPEREPERGSADASTDLGRSCLRRDRDTWVRASFGAVRPGDMIVVPAGYGGCDAFGWRATADEDVRDVGAEAHYRQRLKGALRISAATLSNALDDEASERWQRIERVIVAQEDLEATVLCDALLATGALPEDWTTLLRSIRARRPRVVGFAPDDPSSGVVIWSDARLPRGLLASTDEDEETAGDEAITDREDTGRVGVEVGLIDHLEHVGEKARDIASRAGLPGSVVSLVALAGRLHDLGKADPRFQADLRAFGSLVAQDPALSALLLEGVPLLAKSAQRAAGSRGARATPANFRHEAVSVALAEKHPAVLNLDPPERDLVLWLIGTHHGFGRPFFPVPSDDAPATASHIDIDGTVLEARADEAPLRMDQGWFERAERLARHGPWELARLEAMLRLADHAASAEEQAASIARESPRSGIVASLT